MIRIRRPDMEDLVLDRDSLIGADLSGERFHHGYLFEHKDLSGASFRNSHLYCAWLTNTACVGTDFSSSFSLGAVFSDSDLTNAHFVDTALDHATFDRTILRGCDFTGATLHGANFSAANLDGATFKHSCATPDTKWPIGFEPAAHGVIVKKPEHRQTFLTDNISTHDLRRLLELVLKWYARRGLNQLVLGREDYYCSFPDPEKYRSSELPSSAQVTIGQLYDDFGWLQNYLTDSDPLPINYASLWLGNVLVWAGEKSEQVQAQIQVEYGHEPVPIVDYPESNTATHGWTLEELSRVFNMVLDVFDEAGATVWKLGKDDCYWDLTPEARYNPRRELEKEDWKQVSLRIAVFDIRNVLCGHMIPPPRRTIASLGAILQWAGLHGASELARRNQVHE